MAPKVCMYFNNFNNDWRSTASATTESMVSTHLYLQVSLDAQVYAICIILATEKNSLKSKHLILMFELRPKLTLLTGKYCGGGTGAVNWLHVAAAT